MYEAFTFWTAYGIIMILAYTAPLYCTLSLIDNYIKSITDGDIKDFLVYHTFIKLFSLLGMTEDSKSYCDFDIRGRTVKDVWWVTTFLWLCLIGGTFWVIIRGVILFSDKPYQGDHTLFTLMAEDLQKFSIFIIIPVVLGLVHNILKTTYKKTKNLKVKLDKL